MVLRTHFKPYCKSIDFLNLKLILLHQKHQNSLIIRTRAKPNAFVSEILPQKIFVTTGLFDKFVKNDDELAMILGHEVSHLIEGHFSVSSYAESWIRGAEILVLMLDPTEGLLSLGTNDLFSLYTSNDYFIFNILLTRKIQHHFSFHCEPCLCRYS